MTRGCLSPISRFLASQEVHFLFLTTKLHPDIIYFWTYKSIEKKQKQNHSNTLGLEQGHFLYPYKWRMKNPDINAKAVRGENVAPVTKLTLNTVF